MVTSGNINLSGRCETDVKKKFHASELARFRLALRKSPVEALDIVSQLIRLWTPLAQTIAAERGLHWDSISKMFQYDFSHLAPE